MIHRGPDGFGEYLSEDGQVGLGHRRLKIIDLSEAAAQPMSNEDNTVWIVFNGEIYNYKELTRQLKAMGHCFRSQSDTEVILHAYETWGKDCLDHFIGIFAFAIWDTTRRRLFLVRDHMGVKPLYYSFCKGIFYFSSEQKAILRVSPDSNSVNYEAIYNFLALIRIDHDESTFFSSISQMKPAHYIMFDLDNWKEPEQISYWQVSVQNFISKYDYTNPVESFRELLYDAIRLQLRSDVPIGTMLSGGLDSSSIVAIASQQVSDRMSTFSSIYNEPGYNEQAYIKLITSTFPVCPYFATPGIDEFKSDLERFIWAQEIPTAGPGPLTEYWTAKLAAGRVVVLLNGQGPDEMLGGYYECFAPYIRTLLSQMFRRGYIGLNRLREDLSEIHAITGHSALRVLCLAMLPDPEMSCRATRRFIRDKIFTANFVAFGQAVKTNLSHSKIGGTCLDEYLAQLMVDGLPTLLHYADRNSMAFSLEARVPYLDHRLVEYSFGLEYEWKIRNSKTKYVLRRAMDDVLPPQIAWRKNKLGFATPICEWLSAASGYPVRDILSDAAVRRRGILNPKIVNFVLDWHMRKGGNYWWEIWRWLTLELWFRMFVDNDSSPSVA